jgi:hypothetical protein
MVVGQNKLGRIFVQGKLFQVKHLRARPRAYSRREDLKGAGSAWVGSGLTPGKSCHAQTL